MNARFKDRKEAGRILADKLSKYTNHPNAVVLALPRGGVPVAYEVAQELGLPLDVLIVRKLGVENHKELALGGDRQRRDSFSQPKCDRKLPHPSRDARGCGAP